MEKYLRRKYTGTQTSENWRIFMWLWDYDHFQGHCKVTIDLWESVVWPLSQLVLATWPVGSERPRYNFCLGYLETHMSCTSLGRWEIQKLNETYEVKKSRELLLKVSQVPDAWLHYFSPMVSPMNIPWVISKSFQYLTLWNLWNWHIVQNFKLRLDLIVLMKLC